MDRNCNAAADIVCDVCGVKMNFDCPECVDNWNEESLRHIGCED